MKKPLPSLDRVKELFSYDELSGVFTRRVARASWSKVGEPAGTLNDNGYIRIHVDGVLIYAHRLAIFYVTGEWPISQVDHINGIRSDNRFVNLRSVSRELNCQNLKTAKASNRCGLLGVSRTRDGDYFARIYYNGKSHQVGGRHKTPEAAHAAYIAAKRRIHPGCTI